MSLPSYKTNPARPTSTERNLNGEIVVYGDQGLTQYAEVAARFHAAIMTDTPHLWLPTAAAKLAFDNADAFFAELAKRMTP